MTDLDQALHERGARWTAQQPPAPDLDHALDGALDARASRRPSPRAAVLATAAAVLVVASLAATLWLRRTPVPSADETPVPTEVIATARTFAAGNGDPSPNRIAIVATTFSRTADLFNEPTREDAPVWAIEMTGAFTCGGCMQPGAPARAGVVLKIVIRANTEQPSELILDDHWVDLAPLGEVHDIVPAPEPPQNLIASMRGIVGLESADIVRTSWTQAGRLITTQLPTAPEHVWVVAARGSFSTLALGPFGASETASPSASYELRVYGEQPDGSTSAEPIMLKIGDPNPVDLDALGPVVTVRP